jgi:hypothetical protein
MIKGALALALQTVAEKPARISVPTTSAQDAQVVEG